VVWNSQTSTILNGDLSKVASGCGELAKILPAITMVETKCVYIVKYGRGLLLKRIL